MIGKGLFTLILAIFAAGCSALSAPDPAATLQSNRAAIEAEGTSIAQAAQAQATEVRATVSAAETYVAQGEQINNQLLLTMRAVFPPTQQVVQDQGVITPGAAASPAPLGSLPQTTSGAPESSGGSTTSTLFTQVGTALTVNDIDGCSLGVVTTFAADVQRIYVTTRALNIRSGTNMRVQWSYEGQPAFDESFSVGENDEDFCLWFFIEPTNVTFDAGNWSVQLYADDQAIEPLVSFTIGL